MKITFINDEFTQEFTPPEQTTSVVIKVRANGVSIDYESSTAQAVREFYDAEETLIDMAQRHTAGKRPERVINNNVPTKRIDIPTKRDGAYLDEATRREIARVFKTEKPTPNFTILGERYGVHRTTIGEIIRRSNVPVKRAPVKQRRTWSRKALESEVRDQILNKWATGQYRLTGDLAKELGVSNTSVKRVLAASGKSNQRLAEKGERKAYGKVTPEKRKQIMEMIRDGATLSETVEKSGISQTTISRILREAGVRRGKASRPTRLTDDQKRQIFELAEQYSHLKVAAMVGVSRNTVARVLATKKVLDVQQA